MGVGVPCTHTHTRTCAHTHLYTLHSFLFSQVIEYTGERDLETFSKFLDGGGVLPKEEKDEDEDDDDDDDDDEDEVDEKKEADKAAGDSKVCVNAADLCCFSFKNNPQFTRFPLFQEPNESAEEKTNKTSKDEL